MNQCVQRRVLDRLSSLETDCPVSGARETAVRLSLFREITEISYLLVSDRRGVDYANEVAEIVNTVSGRGYLFSADEYFHVQGAFRELKNLIGEILSIAEQRVMTSEEIEEFEERVEKLEEGVFDE